MYTFGQHSQEMENYLTNPKIQLFTPELTPSLIHGNMDQNHHEAREKLPLFLKLLNLHCFQKQILNQRNISEIMMDKITFFSFITYRYGGFTCSLRWYYVQIWIKLGYFSKKSNLIEVYECLCTLHYKFCIRQMT